jgi:hypothetical protein
MRQHLRSFAAVGAASSLLVIGVSSAGAQPAPAADVPICPPDLAPTDWIDICIDRGDGASYRVGDPIVACMTAHVPQPATAGPPRQPTDDSLTPLPLVRVAKVVDGGPERVVFEEAFAGGRRCLTLSIVPPTGSDLLRVDVVDQLDGRLIASDRVLFTSVGDEAVPAHAAPSSSGRGAALSSTERGCQGAGAVV